jgi:adenylate kinase family enzyme
MNLGKRILVVGANGSGKTTFAKKLSLELKITRYELDNIFWKPGWQETENGEFRAKVEKVTQEDSWIIDGNYARNQDLTLSRAETVIWLDYPLYKIIYRVTKRSLIRSFTKEPLWHNNTESYRKMFSRDSIILFAIQSYPRKSKRYNRLINSKEFNNVNWIRIKNRKDEQEFWENINNRK